MTPEQQRNMLEAAAKACGFECGVYEHSGANSDQWFYVWNEGKKTSRWWNPLSNQSDTAEMCAKLGIDVRWWWGSGEVECQCFFVKDITEFFAHRVSYKDHDNSRLRAWMFAATTCAAKTQGYEP